MIRTVYRLLMAMYQQMGFKSVCMTLAMSDMEKNSIKLNPTWPTG